MSGHAGAGEPRLTIDGRLVEAASGATFANLDPTTEEVIGHVSDAGPEDLDRAIAAARRAFDDGGWSSDAELRRRCLVQLHEALARRADEFREVVIAEAGAPRMLTHGAQCDEPIDNVAYWADLAGSYEYETVLPDRTIFGRPTRRLLRREPAGVVAAITPWNFPMQLNLVKVASALAAGCTVVLKPAPDTPFSATLLGRAIVEETDIPAGVVNIVAAADHEIGAALSADPRVDAVTFTGSTTTGRAVMAAAAPTVKRVFLELGGKSAYIVLDDAELSTVVPAASGMCLHAGQGCALPTRLLVPNARYDEALDLVTAAFGAVRYGDPNDPKVIMGPLISARQRDRVLGYIARGADEGNVVIGGGVPAHLPTGYFVEPTVIADVARSSVVAQEEIFGPVLVVLGFDDDEDAVRAANDSAYGLSGAVFSASLDRALAVARAVRTGTLAVNGAHYFAADTPFGGYRQSGFGKEGGLMGFEEFLEAKVIAHPAP